MALGQTVNSFQGKDGKVNKVITDKGEIDTDLVILCIGFRPNTELVKGQVDMLKNGAIVVDQYMQSASRMYMREAIVAPCTITRPVK